MKGFLFFVQSLVTTWSQQHFLLSTVLPIIVSVLHPAFTTTLLTVLPVIVLVFHPLACQSCWCFAAASFMDQYYKPTSTKSPFPQSMKTWVFVSLHSVIHIWGWEIKNKNLKQELRTQKYVALVPLSRNVHNR